MNKKLFCLGALGTLAIISAVGVALIVTKKVKCNLCDEEEN